MAKRYELTEMDVDLAPMVMKKGSNAAIVAHVISTRRIAAKADINDPESLFRCLDEYLMLCMEQNIKITNMAAYAACGVSKTDVLNWENGRTRRNDPRYREFAVFLRSICSQYREQAMVENIINPVIGIWHQKQYDNMVDQPLPDVAPDSGLEMKRDPEEIVARYKGLLDVNDGEDEQNAI